ncbi:hypothetical protein BLS_008323 [Venturia inaequalis]|uniref:Uncharacterized protein n=1 Tax=Venturia inaequalis TaxID=5025 RepID=A0A8H3VEB8_VENIN|nr:hypothetical protein BLS_008323 [Venturia inaequalis]RDI89348.1 hypothetical protein Vi05172_g649 [Venturia inaequalis]
MGSTRTSSPTALLWAHQLKREHQHLLNRIKALETANSNLASRMDVTEMSAQDTAQTIKSVNELSVRIQAIEEDDNSQQQRFEELDRDRGERFEKLGDGVKKVGKRLQVLEKDLDDRDEESQEKRERAAREKALLVDRLDELEKEYAKLKETAAKGEKLTRKDDTASSKVLNRRMEALEARHKEEGAKVKSLLDKFEKMEKSWSTTQEQLKRTLDEMETVSSAPKRVASPRPTPLIASSSPSTVVQVLESPLAGRQTRRVQPEPKRAKLMHKQLELKKTKQVQQASGLANANAKLAQKQASPQKAHPQKAKQALRQPGLQNAQLQKPRQARQQPAPQNTQQVRQHNLRNRVPDVQPAKPSTRGEIKRPDQIPQTRPRRRIILSPLPPLDEF